MSDEGRVVGFRGEPARVAVEPYEPERPARRPARLALYAAAVLALLLVLDGAYVAWRLTSSLPAAADELERAQQAARTFDVGATERALSDALVHTGAANSATAHPAFRLAGLVPGLAADVGAIDRLAEVGELTARAGLAVTQAITRVAPEAEGLAGAIYRDGRVDFGALDELAPALGEASVLLREAKDLVLQAPRARLGPVARVLAQARAEVPRAASAAGRAVTLVEVLPDLLGRGGGKDYLLMFLSPSEQRATGGFPGLYAVLEARDGSLRLGRVRSIADLSTTERITVPSWFRGAYARYGAVDDARQTGFSPNFPVVADAWLGIYEAVKGEHLDGVIAMDPVAFAELTRATGPISAPGLDVLLGPENAVQVLTRDVYARFASPQAQNAYLAALVEEMWERLGSGELDAAALGAALSTSTSGGHLKVTSTDPAADGALASLGTTWDYTRFGPNVQAVFHNNAGANKIDYFLRRSIDTRVEIQKNGYVLVETSVRLENQAPPEGPSSLLLGPGIEGDEAGLNGMFLHFLLPEGAVFESYSVDGRQDVPAFDDEDGRPLLTDGVEIPARSSSIAVIRYYLSRDPIDPRIGGAVHLTLFPQPGAAPDRYSLVVEGSRGWILELAGERAQRLERSGILDRPVSLAVRVAGSG